MGSHGIYIINLMGLTQEDFLLGTFGFNYGWVTYFEFVTNKNELAWLHLNWNTRSLIKGCQIIQRFIH
jgi:hypothetical protein